MHQPKLLVPVGELTRLNDVVRALAEIAATAVDLLATATRDERTRALLLRAIDVQLRRASVVTG